MAQDILGVISDAITELRSYKLSERTVSEYQDRSFKWILNVFVEHGEGNYNQEIINSILIDNERKCESGIISKQSRNWIRRGCKILEEVYKTGHFTKRLIRAPFETCKDDRFKDFAESRKCNEHTTKDQCSIINKLDAFLQDHGTCINEASFEDLTLFLDMMRSQRPKSMDDVIRAIRAYYQFLNSSGVKTTNAWVLIGAARAREHKVKKPYDLTVLAQVITTMPKDSPCYKRDIAILVLASTTGLRGCDIASLKLSDVKLKDKEIRKIQDKTNTVVNIPLQEIARNAIADYLLNERPKDSLDHTYVFLSSSPPYMRLKDGASVAAILRRRMKQTGVEHKIDDGRTFHGIRRALGTNMVSKGVPVTTVSEVLGHAEIRSTKPYISCDLVGLRKCALSFSAIGGE